MRPIGILLLTIFLLLEGIAGIFMGVGMLLAKEEIYGLLKTEFERFLIEFNATNFISENLFETIYNFTSVATILIGFVYLLIAFGVFMLKNWARIFAIAILAFQFIYSLFLIYFDLLSILGALLSAGFMVYLLRRDVREKFQGKKMTIEERILGKKI
ncbi:MAG: hypothetical protein QXU61_01500 [Archaeoglobaceae archaeon]